MDGSDTPAPAHVALGLYQVGATYFLRPQGSSEADPGRWCHRDELKSRRDRLCSAVLLPAGTRGALGQPGKGPEPPRASSNLHLGAGLCTSGRVKGNSVCNGSPHTQLRSKPAHNPTRVRIIYVLACDGRSTKPDQLHSTADVLCSGETKTRATTPTSFKEKCWKSGDKLLSPPNTLSPLQEKGCRWTDCDS